MNLSYCYPTMNCNQLPSEFYRSLSEYLEVGDLISLSQTNVQLRRVFGPWSWEHCYLIDETLKTLYFDSSLGLFGRSNRNEESLAYFRKRSRFISFSVFDNPENYSWFLAEHVRHFNPGCLPLASICEHYEPQWELHKSKYPELKYIWCTMNQNRFETWVKTFPKIAKSVQLEGCFSVEITSSSGLFFQLGLSKDISMNITSLSIIEPYQMHNVSASFGSWGINILNKLEIQTECIETFLNIMKCLEDLQSCRLLIFGLNLHYHIEGESLSNSMYDEDDTDILYDFGGDDETVDSDHSSIDGEKLIYVPKVLSCLEILPEVIEEIHIHRYGYGFFHIQGSMAEQSYLDEVYLTDAELINLSESNALDKVTTITFGDTGSDFQEKLCEKVKFRNLNNIKGLIPLSHFLNCETNIRSLELTEPICFSSQNFIDMITLPDLNNSALEEILLQFGEFDIENAHTSASYYQFVKHFRELNLSEFLEWVELEVKKDKNSCLFFDDETYGAFRAFDMFDEDQYMRLKSAASILNNELLTDAEFLPYKVSLTALANLFILDAFLINLRHAKKLSNVTFGFNVCRSYLESRITYLKSQNRQLWKATGPSNLFGDYCCAKGMASTQVLWPDDIWELYCEQDLNKGSFVIII